VLTTGWAVILNYHYYYYYYAYYYEAHPHKAAGRKTRLNIQNYGCNVNLLYDHGAAERNRISCLGSHGKALVKECCLPGVLRDSGDTPAHLFCKLNGHLMPYTSCFYGQCVDVCAVLHLLLYNYVLYFTVLNGCIATLKSLVIRLQQ